MENTPVTSRFMNSLLYEYIHDEGFFQMHATAHAERNGRPHPNVRGPSDFATFIE